MAHLDQKSIRFYKETLKKDHKNIEMHLFINNLFIRFITFNLNQIIANQT